MLNKKENAKCLLKHNVYKIFSMEKKRKLKRFDREVSQMTKGSSQPHALAPSKSTTETLKRPGSISISHQMPACLPRIPMVDPVEVRLKTKGQADPISSDSISVYKLHLTMNYPFI